ncbi:hypothetical protein [Streptomyces atratus]|uniref:hypothetical protein n=1 Tax=Streptomyces atratus TaxID=1893 RepID=UPI001300623A|nr:hypothetical protein [Streptomyces atratus]
MTLNNELMDLSNDKGRRMAVFTAEPDFPSAAALQFLADLSAGTFAPQQEQGHVPAGTVKRTALSHFRWCRCGRLCQKHAVTEAAEACPAVHLPSLRSLPAVPSLVGRNG